PGPKKQNPVLMNRTPRPNQSDISRGPNGGSLCPNQSDIDTAPRCPNEQDISRLPSPTAGEASLQGSLTVRAPAQAGGAGSSPAPVTMLEMVAKLSPEVRPPPSPVNVSANHVQSSLIFC